MKNSCCCCFDLKTGGLVLGYLQIFSGILSVNRAIFNQYERFGDQSDSYRPQVFVIALITILVGAMYVYGVHKSKHSFMLPSLVVSWISIVATIFLLVLMPFALSNQSVLDALDKYLDDQDQYASPDTDGLVYVVMAVIWVTLVICTGLGVYFTYVMHSLYRYIKESADLSLPTIHSGWNVLYPEVISEKSQLSKY